MSSAKQEPGNLSDVAVSGHVHDHCDHNHEGSQPLGAMDGSALIAARGLSFARSGRQILHNIDLDLHSGEIVTLIGPNGAGKTTLVRMMLDLEQPDSGVVRRREGLVIGYAPQRFDVDPAIPLTVSRFLTLGKTASRENIADVLREVGTSGLEARQLANLSGGELQRVVLARALLRNPDLLVLDEPVRGVDFAGEAELYKLIGTIREQRNVGVLLVSHDLHVVMAQSDRVICLHGHICCSGKPQKVAQHPEYARLFGPQALGAIGVYQHSHDHDHDLSGAMVPATQPRSRNAQSDRSVQTNDQEPSDR